MLDATNTDISAFVARDGRWILAHGLVDQLPLALATVEYYESLVDRYAGRNSTSRCDFYTIPGFAHTGGPFAAENGIPSLDALEASVERGVAPGNLIASDVRPGNVNRSRPMCIYPAWPKYKGTGDVNSAASFECVTQ